MTPDHVAASPNDVADRCHKRDVHARSGKESGGCLDPNAADRKIDDDYFDSRFDAYGYDPLKLRSKKSGPEPALATRGHSGLHDRRDRSNLRTRTRPVSPRMRITYCARLFPRR
jgi:hypothetical protein